MARYRYTIEQAKKICKEKFHKLPRIGYEIEIESGVEDYWVLDLDGKKVVGKFKYAVHLENNAGTYKIWEWHNPFPEVG